MHVILQTINVRGNVCARFTQPSHDFCKQNVRDRIGSVLTNIYLSDIEYPDRKEKCNKRNPDIATFMAEVSEFGFQWIFRRS